MPDYEAVPAAEWRTWVEQHDAQVLDCRLPEEWALGVLPEAICISMAEIPDSLERLDRDRPVLSVCRSGNRSAAVARFLLAQGFTRVANMEGGMKAIGPA